MPKLVGIFSYFKDLDKVSASDISSWLRFKGDIHILENFIGNRIIYSQTVPLTKLDLNIDLAILREIIKANPLSFYNSNENKIIITKELKERFPPAARLITIIVETINPKGIITIHLQDGKSYQLLGTLIAPSNIEEIFGSNSFINVIVNGKTSQLSKNSLSIAEVKLPTVKVKLGDLKEISVNSGELGIVVDLRDQNTI